MASPGPAGSAAAAATAAAAELAAELASAKAKIQGYVAENEAALAAAVAEHEAVMTALEQQVQALKGQESDATSRASELQAQLRRESELLDAKKAQLAELQSQQTKLPAEVQAAQGEAAAAQAGLTDAQAQLGRKQGELSYAIQELTKGVACFQRLGLEFDSQSTEHVRLVFTQIDAAAPARPFALSLHVSEADAYELRECAPPLPGMPALLAELNATNDFSAFIQKARAAFVALAATPGA